MKPIDTTYFSICDLQFNWGTTFEELEKALAVNNQYNFDSEGYNLEHTCESAFNLNATKVKTSAYNKNRPVFKLQYDLVSIHNNNIETYFEPYLSQLVKILGTKSSLEKGKYSSSETYYFQATWIINDVTIKLWVSKTGENKSELDNANIRIHWRGIHNYNTEISDDYNFNSLTDIVNHLVHETDVAYKIDYFKLDWEQSRDECENNFSGRMYKNNLFITPTVVSGFLDNKKIAIYELKNLNLIFVSNKWETTCIQKNKGVVFKLVEIDSSIIYATKQEYYLTINGLLITKITSDYQNEDLQNIIQKIEELTEIKVENTSE